MNNWQFEKKRIAKALLPKKFLVTCLLLLETVSVICIAYAIQDLLNAVSSSTKNISSQLIGIIGLLLFQCGLLFIANKSFNDLGTKSREYVRNYAFKSTIINDISMSKFQTGDLLSRVFTDAGDVGERIGQRTVLLVAGILQTVITLGLLFYTSWIVGICVLVIYPLYFFVTGLINNKIRKCTSAVRFSQAKTQHVLLKGLQGILELTVMNKQEYYADKYSLSLKNTSKNIYQYNNYSAINMMIRNFICTSLPVLAVILCTSSYLAQETTIILFVYILVGYLVQPLNSLSNLFQYISEDSALEKRLEEVLQENSLDEKVVSKLDEINSIEVNIEKYCIGDREIFASCIFKVLPGELLLIKGESGCGKSTLLKLLIKQGCLENIKGVIKINGDMIQDIEKYSLYTQISFVNQTSFIFEDSLYNNLCMGEEYSLSDIMAVLDVCCLTDFASEYGLDYIIAEDGKNISVGQLQRICIARALLQKRKCLLLDEPTSALDEEMSRKLMGNLLKYTRDNGLLTICVTHKNDFIEEYDNVLYLDN